MLFFLFKKVIAGIRATLEVPSIELIKILTEGLVELLKGEEVFIAKGSKNFLINRLYTPASSNNFNSSIPRAWRWHE